MLFCESPISLDEEHTARTLQLLHGCIAEVPFPWSRQMILFKKQNN